MLHELVQGVHDHDGYSVQHAAKNGATWTEYARKREVFENEDVASYKKHYSDEDEANCGGESDPEQTPGGAVKHLAHFWIDESFAGLRAIGRL